jgi:phage terminase large subunit
VAAIVVQSIFRNFLKIIFEINVLKQFKNLKQLILIKKFNF